METPPVLANEVERLAALKKLAVLDTPADPSLDRITQLASMYFGTKIALISLIDSERQWFKSRVGLETAETPRDISFCGHALTSSESFIIPDAKEDLRFLDNPLVLGDPNIRFYAGRPLKGPGDELIGTLCVIDDKPHHLTETEELMLAVLGEAAERVLLADWERGQQVIADETTAALEQIIDTTAFGVITIDEFGTIQAFNSGAEQMFGFLSEEVTGINVGILMPAEVQEEHAAMLARIRETGSTSLLGRDRIVEAERRTGERFPMAISISQVHSEGRQKFTALISDLSKLTAAEADRNAFFTLSVDLFCILDEEGKFLRLNPAFLEMLGYSMEDLFGETFFTLMLPEDHAFVSEQLNTVLQGGSVKGIEARCLCKDGSLRDLVWTARSDPRTGRIYASARDTTEIKQLKTDIDLFFSLSLDLFCIVGNDGNFVRVNPALQNLLGYSDVEMYSHPFLDLVAPADRDRARASALRQAEGYVSSGFEARSIGKDGALRTILWSSRADAESGRIYASGRDITEQRIREAEMARLVDIVEASVDFIAMLDAEGNIQHLNGTWRTALGLSADSRLPRNPAQIYGPRVAALLLEEALPTAIATGSWTGEAVMPIGDALVEVQQTVLAHTLDGLEGEQFISIVSHDIGAFKEVERVKDDFISTVSHELRTPLTSIRGSLGLLDGGAMGELPDKAKTMVKIASQNTDRLVRLINDVLDLEKMNAGKLELHLAPEDLFTVTEEAINGVLGMASTLEIEVVGDFVDSPLPVRIDHDRMVQVITNLLSNALKFSSAGSEVKVSLRLADEHSVELAVADSGSGIPADKLEFVFDRFAQVDSTSTRAKGGTGLGLAIVQEIVEMHGGTIRVTSAVGQGSTFTVILPMEVVPSVAVEPREPRDDGATLRRVATAKSASERVGGRLLVVEDDEQLSQVIVALLEGAGHDVVRAANLLQARASIHERVPDAIVLDLRLPDGHGLELLEDLKTDPKLSHVRVLIVSGSQDTPDAMPMPVVVRWLRKPFSNREILDSIGVVLEAGVRPSVLVIDDDEPTREVIAAMLESEGIDVLQAINGRAALDLLEEFRPDLIILDLSMPVMDGYEFMKSRAPIAAEDIPVVVYTGQDLTAAQEVELSGGLTTFLTKTRTSDRHFISAIKDALEPSQHSGPA